MKIRDIIKRIKEHRYRQNKSLSDCENQKTNSAMKYEHQYPQLTRKDRSIGRLDSLAGRHNGVGMPKCSQVFRASC